MSRDPKSQFLYHRIIDDITYRYPICKPHVCNSQKSSRVVSDRYSAQFSPRGRKNSTLDPPECQGVVDWPTDSCLSDSAVDEGLLQFGDAHDIPRSFGDEIIRDISLPFPSGDLAVWLHFISLPIQNGWRCQIFQGVILNAIPIRGARAQVKNRSNTTGLQFGCLILGIFGGFNQQPDTKGTRDNEGLINHQHIPIGANLHRLFL